jgi:hypothetical protein
MRYSNLIVNAVAASMMVGLPTVVASQEMRALGADPVPVACSGPGESPLDGASVLGSPGRDVGGAAGAGAVEIRRSVGGLPDVSVTLTPSSVGVTLEPGLNFGSAVAVGRITAPDECLDLVIGMPGADSGRGAIVVVPDFGSGLEPAAAAWLPTSALGLQPFDFLGQALVVMGRTIFAGAPGRDVGAADDAGALYGWWVDRPSPPDPRGIHVTQAATFVQGSGGVLGQAEPDDRFGSVLYADFVDERLTVVVGIPEEDVGRARDAGAVALLEFDYVDPALTLDSNYLLWQGSGLPGRSRSGDRLGAAVWYSDLRGAYGVPGKDANGVRDSGAVIVSDGRYPLLDRRYVVVTQNTRGVPDRSERGDAFGSALARVLWTVAGRGEYVLSVGVPGEDVAGRRDAGAVTHLGMPGEVLDRSLYSAQRVSGLARGDRFGSRLVAVEGYFGDPMLLIGAPGEDRPGARNAGRYYRVVPHPLALPTAVVHLDGTTRNEGLGG